MKNLYLRRNGYYFSKMEDGKRVWVNLQTRDASVAVKRLMEVRINPLVQSERTIKDDVQEFLAYQVRENRYSPNSRNAKEKTLLAFCTWLPSRSTTANVSRDQISAYYAYLRKKVKKYSEDDPKFLTEDTIQGYLMTLRSFFRWAVEVKRVRIENPVAKVKLSKTNRISKKPWVRRKDKKKLIENAPNDEMRFILFCGFDAGLRREEIVEARRDWFDLEEGILHVRKADKHRIREGEREFKIKDREERAIPLTGSFRRFLKDYLKGLDPLDFALYADLKHRRWRYRYDFRRPFMDYMKAQGFGWVTPHTMRRSFASILVSAGKSIYKVAQWMGDKVEVVQNNYGHLEPADEDIEALG